MPSAEQRREAYAAGRAAYLADRHTFRNPHTPAPPGDVLLARLWRAGWDTEHRKDQQT